jgi:hypothetical protein
METRQIKLTGIVKFFKEIELIVEVPNNLNDNDIVPYIDADKDIQDMIDKAYANAPYEMYLDSDEIIVSY